MKGPTRDQLVWVAAGLVSLVVTTIAILVSEGGSPDTLALTTGLAAGAGFFVVYGWTVSRKTGALASKVALPCFLIGYVSLAPLPVLRLNSLVYGVAAFLLVLLGTVGLVHLWSHEMLSIRAGRKPVFAKEDRILRLGFLSLIVGATVAFLTTWPSPFQVRLPYFSPVRLAGETSWIAGVVLVSLAIILARKKKGERSPV